MNTGADSLEDGPLVDATVTRGFEVAVVEFEFFEDQDICLVLDEVNDWLEAHEVRQIVSISYTELEEGYRRMTVIF